ncbi:hypothetical protein T02_1281 [Trichinella nativa]|uniref:Uncharacterized protein n=1 Tax=Trichinella nativa TaxID=6335 RepID=A0A0V1L2B2_9BILA|nr:hypothetical protein T02_1281 [Trichinella nativa]
MQNLKLVILPLFLFDVRENFLLVGSTNDNYSRLFIIGNLNRLVVHIDMRNNERHLIDRPAKFFGDANGCWLVALRYLKRWNNYRRKVEFSKIFHQLIFENYQKLINSIIIGNNSGSIVVEFNRVGVNSLTSRNNSQSSLKMQTFTTNFCQNNNDQHFTKSNLEKSKSSAFLLKLMQQLFEL